MAQAASPSTGVKVFVGNLSFKTHEAELAQEFAVAGKVISANIITRGPRSLGYGFVELETDAEANKAVELLNKKEIDGRQINVEVARPRQERPESDQSGQQQGGNQQGGQPRRGSFRGGRGGRGSGRGGRGGRGGRRGGDQQQGGNRDSGNQQQGGQQNGGEGQAQRQPRQRRRGGNREGQQQQQGGAEGEQQQGAPNQRRRGGRGRGSGARTRGGANRRADDGPREESDTTLFVANLPFSVTDESLKQEFGAGGLNVKAAHVVTRVTGRSKGYGFVEYESKADQGRALSSFENKELEGRQLIVKIALKDNRPPTDADAQQGQQQTQQ